jgi:hypothetical protein
MTAFDLIDSIFSRVQEWMPSNERRISGDQYHYLLDLIGGDPEGSALKNDGPNVMIWKPSGRHKYIIRRDPEGKRNTITKISNLTATESGRLF